MLKSLIAAAAFLICLGGGIAQAQNSVEVEVPFEFNTGKWQMPAGTYTIERNTSGYIVFQKNDRSASSILVTHGVSNPDRKGEGRLVFRRYGDRHFFAELWHPNYDTGRAVTPTPLETEMARTEGPVQLASIPVRLAQ
jgi:hypothetical protein